MALSQLTKTEEHDTVGNLAAQGYWPARASRFVEDGKYSRAVEICRESLSGSPGLLSGRLVFGKALYLTGNVELAEEQFLFALSLDPDNLMALKYLADIKYSRRDEPAAIAYYRRVLEIDPRCRGLACDATHHLKETTRTISISRGAEPSTKTKDKPLRPIPFYTETMGDLYLSQGHSRLAAEVFRSLVEENRNPRLVEKLSQAEGKIKDKGN
jgi:tetratricopeptide (TPR) repeat protein